MPTGDGLLARVHPPLGVLTLAQARAVAAGARQFGNGHIDLTARANLQVRGVSEATRAPLAHLLEAVGLGDARDDGGPQRLTLTSPLAGCDPAELIDVPGLALAIEAAGHTVAGLPAKTLVAIDGRPYAEMPDADFYVAAVASGRVRLAVTSDDGPLAILACGLDEALAGLAGMLIAFARSGRRRSRDLSAEDRKALVEAGLTASASPPPPSPDPLRGPPSPARGGGIGRGGNRAVTAIPPAGVVPLAPGLFVLAVDAPFGRCTADSLDDIANAADTLGAEEIRLSPARGFVLTVRDRGRALGALADLSDSFITAPGDPRRSIAACTGAPACASGSTPTLADAGRIAQIVGPLASARIAIHVSGCAKGCARPGAADLTLVARDGLYGAVLAGGPGDPPGLHLPIEAALERLGRATTIGLAAAFAPDYAATGCGNGGRPG